MNTLENNKLIAEFMGLVEPYELPQHGTIRPNGNFKIDFTLAQLKYHTSWDWLMPVVEKIEDDERFDVEILQYGTLILCNQEEIVNNVANISFDKKIKHTYQAVVEFIKWYNENK